MENPVLFLFHFFTFFYYIFNEHMLNAIHLVSPHIVAANAPGILFVELRVSLLSK